MKWGNRRQIRSCEKFPSLQAGFLIVLQHRFLLQKRCPCVHNLLLVFRSYLLQFICFIFYGLKIIQIINEYLYEAWGGNVELPLSLLFLLRRGKCQVRTYYSKTFFFWYTFANIYECGGLVAKSCATLAAPWTVAHQLLCP